MQWYRFFEFFADEYKDKSEYISVKQGNVGYWNTIRASKCFFEVENLISFPFSKEFVASNSNPYMMIT